MSDRALTVTARSTLILALGSALLGGCAEMHRGFEAVGRVGSTEVPVQESEVVPASRPDIKTVRPRGAVRAPVSDMSDAEPAAPTVVAAVPSSRQIFDFHPPGSPSGSFRQPFIINPNDGPLTADVQRSAEELREFMAGLKTGTKTAERKRCSETDVATAKAGCVMPATKAATAAASQNTIVP